MTLPSPILDDRSYAQLRDELIRRIPVYNREWNDHNPSDPGITLIELFAYLGETLLFRFNQIPEATKLEFLRLLQIQKRAPSPARAMLRMTTEELAGVLVAPGSEAKAGSLPFEVRTETRVLPVSALAICKAASEQPDESDDPERFGQFQRVIDALDGLESDEEAAPYDNVELDVDGQALAVDFDEAVDASLWIAVLAEGDHTPADIRAAIAEHDEAPVHLNIGFVPDITAPPPDEVDPCPGEGTLDTGTGIEWRISTGRFDDDEPIYTTLRVGGDSTGGLEREGVVRLEMPRSLDDIGTYAVEVDLAGTRDLPPALDEEVEDKLVCWIRGFRTDGGGLGKIQWIGLNASELVQQRKAKTVFLGTGNGQPSQEFELPHKPVVPGSAEIQVEASEGWATWREVDGFHYSDEESRHYMIDHQSGKIRFGNGIQGRAPQIGERVRARSWFYGGGVEGNVAVGAISKVSVAQVECDNPLPGWAGSAAETIAEALDRMPGEFRRRDRAVTRGDFAELAAMTPGAAIGRAEVLPLFHPPTRVSDAAGVVSVVIWPTQDTVHPDAPVPDTRTLRRVCEWLDQRRLVTTELYVIPPRYRRISVAVGIVVKPGYPIEGVRRWVELILRQYLAPLPPYGPEGAGWPLGRRVIAAELEAAALQVEGVEYVRNLRIADWKSADESWDEVKGDASAEPPVEALIELALDEVVELAEITVVEGPALVPGEALGSPDVDGKTPVPVPVEREEC